MGSVQNQKWEQERAQEQEEWWEQEHRQELWHWELQLVSTCAKLKATRIELELMRVWVLVLVRPALLPLLACELKQKHVA